MSKLTGSCSGRGKTRIRTTSVPMVCLETHMEHPRSNFPMGRPQFVMTSTKHLRIVFFFTPSSHCLTLVDRIQHSIERSILALLWIAHSK